MMHHLFRSAMRAMAVLVMGASLIGAPAYAIDDILDAAQKGGVIGERADGYLGFVRPDEATGELRRRVAEVNAQRREVYTRKSQQTGESLAVIAALAAEVQIGRTDAGEYYMNRDGVWVKK